MGRVERYAIPFKIMPLLLILLLTGACGESSDPVNPGPSSDSSADHWVLERSQQTQSDLLSTWGTAPDDVWAIGVTGALLHYDGDGWQLQDPWDRNVVNLWQVWGLADDAVWAVGDHGTVLHYDGRIWRFMPRVEDLQLRGIWGTASDDLWVVCLDSRIFHYDGMQWEMVYDHTSPLYAITGTGSEDIYACGGTTSVLHFDGIDWTPMTLPPVGPIDLWSLSIDDQDRAWVCGGDGYIFRHAAGSWTTLDTPTSETLLGIECFGDLVFAAGFNGTILRFDGTDWGTMTSGVSHWLRGIQIFGANDIFITGGQGTLLRWDGETWGAELDGFGAHLEDVWVAPDGSVFAVGNGVLRRAEGLWTSESVPPMNWYGVWGRDAEDVYVVGDGGTILHYDGTDWTAMNSGTGVQLYGVSGTATGPVYAVGQSGTVLQLEDDTWLPIGIATSTAFTSILAQEDGTLIVAGFQVVFRRDPTTEEWREEYTGYFPDYWGITGTADGTVYLNGRYRIFVSSGNEWSQLPYSSDRWKTDLHVEANGTLWATQDDGRILRYEDGVWRVDARPAPYPLTGIHGNADGELYVVGVEGLIFRYDP